MLWKAHALFQAQCHVHICRDCICALGLPFQRRQTSSVKSQKGTILNFVSLSCNYLTLLLWWKTPETNAIDKPLTGLKRKERDWNRPGQEWTAQVTDPPWRDERHTTESYGQYRASLQGQNAFWRKASCWHWSREEPGPGTEWGTAQGGLGRAGSPVGRQPASFTVHLP